MQYAQNVCGKLNVLQHHVMNQQVEISGDEATWLSKGIAYHELPVSQGEGYWLLYCRYEHGLRKIDGKWKITRIKMMPFTVTAIRIFCSNLKRTRSRNDVVQYSSTANGEVTSRPGVCRMAAPGKPFRFIGLPVLGRLQPDDSPVIVTEFPAVDPDLPVASDSYRVAQSASLPRHSA